MKNRLNDDNDRLLTTLYILSMTSFSQFLNSFNPETKGKQFEVFVKRFLKNDPYWSSQVDQIWLWDEWPGRWGRDKGVDLIFKHKNGETWAVQAKCYSQNYEVTKSDVDKFLSESNRKQIDKRLLIASTDRLGENAIDAINNQHPKEVICFLFSDFEKAEFVYPDHISKLSTAKRKAPPTPRPHQLEAIDAADEGFKNNDRGQLIMACGTGKTFVSLWVKERISAQSTLVLVPSLSLLSQTLREWTFAAKESFEVLCVCSDESVGDQSDEDSILKSVKDLSFPVTTDSEKIKHFLKGRGNKVIFSTYQSSALIAESQSGTKSPALDLAIADEAHRCTGEESDHFTTILKDSLIKAKKRLFITSTSKRFKSNVKEKAEERGVEIFGMDDELVFGEVFYSLPFGEAIERELLTDYQVVIVGVDDPTISEWIENRELVKTDSGETMDSESLAAYIGLLKAIKDYDLKRIISFHRRIKSAEEFSLDLPSLFYHIPEKHLPKGKLLSDYVSGEMSSYKRNIKIKNLKELFEVDRGLLANVRCLSEGVDLPSLDGVAFIDPKDSEIDIVQAVGRAIRLSKDKKIGTIYLPVFLKEGNDVESALDSSIFKPVANVLKALKSHDDILSFELDQFRTNLGKKGKKYKIKGFRKIVFDLPKKLDASFSESLRTMIVEQTTESWFFLFGLLENYVDSVGDALVPTDYKVDGKYKLGNWVSTQRSRKENLTSEKIIKLESLEGWTWDLYAYLWNLGISGLKDYVNNNGHSLVPNDFVSIQGFKLGSWVSGIRSKKGKLTKKRLNEIELIDKWVWDVNYEKWEIGYSKLKIFIKDNGHSIVPRVKGIDEYNLRSWVSNQRTNYIKNKLTKKQIKRLESLKVWTWEPINYIWERNFTELIKYIDQNGTSLVKASHITDSKIKLGNWVSNLRIHKDRLRDDQIKRLETLIDWTWDVIESKWIEGKLNLIKYYKENGNALVPSDHICSNGYNLGSWVGNQRTNNKKDKLSKDKITFFESLNGWVWNKKDFLWEIGFNHLLNYIKEYGDSKVPEKFRNIEYFHLGMWVKNQRLMKDKMLPERISMFEELSGWSWDVLTDLWNQNYEDLKNYYKKYNTSFINSDYKTSNKKSLRMWASRQKNNPEKLSKERFNKLDSLDLWIWDIKDFQWDIGFEHLKEYIKTYGNAIVFHSHVCKDGYKLGSWVANQRRRQNRLTLEKFKRLEDLNEWVWGIVDSEFENKFSYLIEFYKTHGHYLVKQDYVCDDGYKLGTWISHIRLNRNTLPNELKSKFDHLEGWVWNAIKYKWELGIKSLKKFIEDNGHSHVKMNFTDIEGYNLGTFVANIRNRKKKLKKEQIDELNRIGFEWEKKFKDLWRKNLEEYKDYILQNETCHVPNNFISESDFNLGQWVSRTRQRKDKLSNDKIEILNEIGFIWDTQQYFFEQNLSRLKEFIKENGHAKVPAAYKTQDGYNLGSWISNIRLGNIKIGKLQKKALSEVGFLWDISQYILEHSINHNTKMEKVTTLLEKKVGNNLI